jgi:DNA-directed RNA polymerase subunit RPC12/RpoP
MKRKEPMTLAEMAARAASNTIGIACPKCDCRDFRTYKTTRGVSAVFRYKACRHCGHKVLTTSQTSERVIRDIEQADDGEPIENDIL